MNATMEYNGYVGSIEYSDEDECMFGKVLGINSLLLYEGENVKTLKSDFQNTVDEYISLCEERNIKPEKSFNSPLNLFIKPDICKAASLYAINHGQTFNSFIEEAIQKQIMQA